MSQNLLRLQLEAASLNSPTLPLSTPPSPFINWPSTPTTNGQGFFNWPSSMNFPSTPTLPYFMTSPTMMNQNETPAQVQSPAPAENRGYTRWWESESEQKGRTSSGGDSGRGYSETPSSVDHDGEDEDVFVDVDSSGDEVTARHSSSSSSRTATPETATTETPPSTGNSKRQKLPPKKRPRAHLTLATTSSLQNAEISSTSRGAAPMTLPAPFGLPVTPLSIPNTPHSLPASPWHYLLQRQMWNNSVCGTPYSPVAPTSPTFFKFPPPPSFFSPQSDASTRPPHSSSSGQSPMPSSSFSAESPVCTSPVTPEWLDGLRRQLAVLPSDSLHLMSDAERDSRCQAMSNLTEEQYQNLRRYLEKRSYSVRDEIGKEDYVPRPIVLRSEFVSLRGNRHTICQSIQSTY